MIIELKGYANATRATLSRVTALIIVLAIMCAGTAFAASPSTYNVDIYDGSEITRVSTFKSNPQAIVDQAGIVTTNDDVLNLDGFTVGQDSIIVLYRAADITFTDLQGNVTNEKFAGTVADFLSAKGVVLSEDILVNLPEKTVLQNSMNVKLQTAYNVLLTADGATTELKTGDGTVSDAVAKAGVTLGENDEVSPSLETELYDGIQITVYRVEYVERTAQEAIKYTTQTVKSDELYLGNSKVTQKGVNGSKTVIYSDKIVDGQLASSSVVSETVTKEAVPQIKTVGTKEKPAVTVAALKNGGTPISELTPPSSLTLENGVPTSYKRVVTGKAAAYSASAGAKTASGRTVKPGYIAVDPNQFPYGTELYIVSTDGIVYGYCIAADTGGFVKKGKFTVDLFMNTTAQCRQWGARDVIIYVL